MRMGGSLRSSRGTAVVGFLRHGLLGVV